MKTRTGLLVTTAVSALVIGLSCGNQALAADMVTKAPPAVAAVGWWSSVYAEVGGRFFIDDHGGGTGGNFLTPPGAPNGPTTHLLAGPFSSLGKFYEYRDLRPGPFGELFAAGGSGDGLYQYGFLAKNIGYRDQSYLFDWSQAGVQYLTLGFDQTPHTYNNNATTIFQGAGTDTLTIDPAVRQALVNQQITCLSAAPDNSFVSLSPVCSGKGNHPAGNNTAAVASIIENNLNSFRLGFDRYTGTADYRWTPTDNWDVKVDYNITRREGTQPAGALTFNAIERGGRVVLELPRPIHDETHNANVNVEYAGVTPWGKKFNITAGYGVSIYHDDSDSFSFQNPWAVTNAPEFPTFTPLTNVMSLPPSNMANMFRFNGALDLPMKSRWVAAVSYTHGQQDQGFLPLSATPGLIGGTGTFIPPAPAGKTCTPGLPNSVDCFVSNGVPPTLTGSSNFGSNTLLVNNVLTTKWTTELTQTSRYRFYDYDASHDPVTLSYLLVADSANGTDPDDAFLSRGVAYTKQNAGTDFVWRPASVRWLTLGAGGAWEQWDRHWRGSDPGIPDVHVTNEFMGKVFATAKPWDWSQFRGSYLHAERRFEGTFEQNIGGNDESCESAACTGFRSYDLANRNRDKLNLSLDLYAPNGLVITPTGGFRFDDYSSGIVKDDFGGGLIHDDSWNAGVEVAWTVNPFLTLVGSYVREQGSKEIWIPFTSHTPGILNIPWSAFADDKIDTFMAAANLVLIPDKWDIKLAYTMMYAKGSLSAPPTNPAAFFPDQTQTLNRVDVQSKYKVDPTFMQRFGFNGETYVKLRYLWEHNEVSDWAAVNWNYMYLFNTDTSQNKNIMLGWNNPNYNVQLLMASVAFKW